MIRYFVCLLGLLLVITPFHELAAQQDSWPPIDMGGQGAHGFQRGPGFYFGLVKIGFVLVLFWLWVKTTDWVSQDSQLLNLPYVLWVSVAFFPFFVGFFLFGLFIPIFFVGYFLLLLSYGVPLGVYIWQRNNSVPSHLKVLTSSHLKHLAEKWQMRLTGKKPKDKSDKDKAPEISLLPMGAPTESENQANGILARQSPGYKMACKFMADALQKRAERIALDYTAEAVQLKIFVDGMWHELPPHEREEGDFILLVLKKLANLNAEDRRSKQAGKLGIDFKGTKHNASIQTQGTATGEKVSLEMIGKSVKFTSHHELGMRPKMEEKLKSLLAKPRGVVLFSSLPSGGLTTTFTISLKLLDRFMRDVVSMDDAAKLEPEVENVEVITYGNGGDPPDVVLTRIKRKQPSVVVVRDFLNGEIVDSLLEFATSENKLIIGTVRAKDAVEAPLRVLALKPSDNAFSNELLAVLNQRLIRKLCDKCKFAYEPTPDLLRKLGIPPGRIDSLFREPQPSDFEKPPTEPCQQCGGIGYFGRTSIFELLVMNDALREALKKQPKIEVLKQLARQSGQASLVEEGVVLVAQGITSVSEFQRALKQ